MLDKFVMLQVTCRELLDKNIMQYYWECVADLKQVSQSFSSLSTRNLPSGNTAPHPSQPKQLSCQNSPRKL